MEKQKSYFAAILIISIILIGGCTILLSGCAATFDPCESTYNTCVHNCGEGILSSICKEKCTSDRNTCKESAK